MLKISPNKVGKIMNLFSVDTLKLEQAVQEVLKAWVVSCIFVFQVYLNTEFLSFAFLTKFCTV